MTTLKLLRRLFFTVLFALVSLSGNSQLKRFGFSQPKMGSPLQIIFYTEDSIKAKIIAEKCFQLVDSLVVIYSDYIDSSELNKLSLQAGTNKYVKVSDALFDIISTSKIAYEKSERTFDITLAPITKLWRNARKQNLFPNSTTIKEKLSLTGFNKIKIDQANHTVMLVQPGMQLDLGGIAQGYIAQKIIDFLQIKDIVIALVDVSGDIAVTGVPPGTKGWNVGINFPEETDELQKKTLVITNKAVTTSGDVYQYIDYNGKRYSHIVDPRTGYGITSQKNVTVIADEGTTADWLTKPCSILPLRKAKKLAHSLNAEVLVGEIKKGKLVLKSTKGFRKYWKQN